MSSGDAPAHSGIFARSGEYWTIGYGGKSFSLKEAKGLKYIERLLRHPGEEFHALDLLREPIATTASGSTGGDLSAVLADPGVSIGGLGDAGEMLDAQAKHDYKRRLYELREELADLRDRGVVDRAEKVQSEIDFLAREIARAVGLKGRDRRVGVAVERARLNATRAIRAAVQRISEHHPALGEMLDRSIRTGSCCSYAPHPRTPVSWQFSLGVSQASAEDDAAVTLFLRREARFLEAFTEGTTFVGREPERATLRKFLEEARRGQGKVVVIGGAPGVGKTRIAAEIGAEASRDGFLTFVGGCYDREDSVPFIPFVEILEAGLAQAGSPAAFRDALGTDAPELARLLPQLRRLYSDIAAPLELPPEQSRRVLFNAVAALVVRTARRRPLLLLLDDLHWADEGTLLLLNHVAPLVAKMPVLIVGTYRDFELQPNRPLAKTLDVLIRLHLVERITLGGLSQDGVAHMLRALSGREPPEKVVDLFYSQTEGNPFFVEELFRHLVEQGKLTDSAGEFARTSELTGIDVPQTLRLVIGSRLARLSQATQKTLGAAAGDWTFLHLRAARSLDPGRRGLAAGLRGGGGKGGADFLDRGVSPGAIRVFP